MPPPHLPKTCQEEEFSTQPGVCSIPLTHERKSYSPYMCKTVSTYPLPTCGDWTETANNISSLDREGRSAVGAGAQGEGVSDKS